MKKFYFFFAFALMAIAASAQEPLYTFETTATNDASWGDDWAPYFVLQGTKVKVEVYDANYVIIRNWGGTEGNDLKVEYDPNIDTNAETCLGNVINVSNIYNGVEAESVVYQGYYYSYTGRNDEYAVCATYINEDGTLYWSFVNVDKENKTGSVSLSGYYCDSDYTSYSSSSLYYYVEWPSVETSGKPLFTFETEVTNDASWGEEWAPYFVMQGTKVNVEVYDANYVIIRNWGGTEGNDLKVEYDPTIDTNAETCLGNVINVTNIYNGVEAESVVYQGYYYSYTGRNDEYAVCATYINEDGTLYWSFVNVDKENKTGSVSLSGYYCDSEYTNYSSSNLYYYVEWPSGEDEPVEPVNPFDGEATLLYSAVAKTGDAGGTWGTSVFPVVENIKVDVYDKYIYIHALGGVEGYDLKVAYDKDENVTSVISITNGKDGEPSETASYIYTGREDKYCLYAYYYGYSYGYSYAATYEDNSGYVILGCYIYNPDNTSDWSYYYLSWDKASENGIDSITTDINSNGAKFNLSGMRVNDDYKGIVIKNGKKVIQTGK